jgi:hypothetical protein
VVYFPRSCQSQPVPLISLFLFSIVLFLFFVLFQYPTLVNTRCEHAIDHTYDTAGRLSSQASPSFIPWLMLIFRSPSGLQCPC